MSVVVKYADNILKGFAASFSIVTSFILCVFIFDFVPTYGFVFGAVSDSPRYRSLFLLQHLHVSDIIFIISGFGKCVHGHV